jgi:hypothetical protein
MPAKICSKLSFWQRAFVIFQFISLLICNSTGGEIRKPLTHNADFPIDKLAAYENCSILQINAQWKIAACSKRLNNQNFWSEIVAYRLEENRWKQAFHKIFNDAYNARIELRSDMQYRANPIIAFRIQYGAAYEEQFIYGIEAGSVRLLQELAAGTFEWSYQPKDLRTLLVGIPAHPHLGEQTILYKWDGTQFKKVKSP